MRRSNRARVTTWHEARIFTPDPDSRVGSEETAILTKRFSGDGNLFIGGISNSKDLKF